MDVTFEALGGWRVARFSGQIPEGDYPGRAAWISWAAACGIDPFVISRRLPVIVSRANPQCAWDQDEVFFARSPEGLGVVRVGVTEGGVPAFPGWPDHLGAW